MKNWFVALLLLPLFSFAQDCKLKKTTDPFTHVAKLSTGFQNFDGSGISLSVSADATPTEIDFFFWIKDNSKCFDAESTAFVVFEGERSKTTFRNTGSMNCEGAFHFGFKNTPTTHSWLNRLATKKVSTIKLNGSNKTEVLITLTEEQKALLQAMAACMVSEGKGLIKK